MSEPTKEELGLPWFYHEDEYIAENNGFIITRVFQEEFAVKAANEWHDLKAEAKQLKRELNRNIDDFTESYTRVEVENERLRDAFDKTITTLPDLWRTRANSWVEAAVNLCPTDQLRETAIARAGGYEDCAKELEELVKTLSKGGEK